jgi:betaine-aldehyde dehydrogenase
MGMPNTDVLVGPVNNAAQFARVNGFIERVPSHARVVAGGSPNNLGGYFIAPTVIADLKQRARSSDQ